MKSFYLLLTTLSIAYANKCSTNVDSTTGVLTWNPSTDGTTIPPNAFEDCNTIKIAVFNGVTSIGNNAFKNAGDAGGMNLTFNALETISQYAFYDTKIKSFTAPSVTTIEPGAIEMMTSVASGIDFTFDALTSIQAEGFRGAKIKSLVAPLVTTIGDNAFVGVNDPFDGTTIQLDLNFPALTTIEHSAFKMANIKSLVAPLVTTIGVSAFKNAGHADGMDLNFPVLTSIGVSAFELAKIKSLVAPSLITIPVAAFYGAGHVDGMDLTFDALDEISSVQNSIVKGAFERATIKSLVAPLLTKIGSKALLEVNFITTIQLDLNFPALTSIDEQAFKEATIKSLVAPSLITIPVAAFQGAGHVDGMDLTFDALDDIGNNAFDLATIKSLVAPLLTRIGSRSFENVNQDGTQNNLLLDLNFPVLTHIPENAFQGARLNTLIVPSISSASGTDAFKYTKVANYVVISKASGLQTNNDIQTIHYVDDVLLYLGFATQQQLKTEYHGRGLLTEDVPLYLPIATKQQLKTEYQSRGTCT
ncbi:MAG: hypothetical protein CMF41_04055 [Legionellales bacterium]|nr:hypothetical protein [Legionellales bacterium]